jgi:hypothetical protein
MRIFGHSFSKLDTHHLDDLTSLEREGAVFTDHWIDELADFRHVRIKLSDKEISEYVRSMVAFDRFLGSKAKWARSVKSIPKDIAKRADAYVMRTKDGQVFGPPYHCAAGFMGRHLESIMCGTSRHEILDDVGKAGFLHAVRRAVDALTPSIRCFRNREAGLARWPISREDDVRDLLFVMLRSAVSDIKREEPIPSRAGRSKVADLHTHLARTLFEIKWVRRKAHWKQILDEIHVDVQTYGRHPDCDHLIIVVVDAARGVPDPRTVETQLTSKQTIDGRTMNIVVYIREP